MENRMREFVAPALGGLGLCRVPHGVGYGRALLIALVVLGFLSGAGVASAGTGKWTSPT